MRKIKFRAWDKRRKIMLEPFTLWELYDDGQDLDHESNSMFINRKYNLFEKNDFIFLQFTGLKDKNGKEIYEKDILEGKHFHEEFDEWRDATYIVKWDKKSCCFYLDSTIVSNSLCPDGKIYFDIDLVSYGSFYIDLDESKVIGNIFVNPELLK